MNKVEELVDQVQSRLGLLRILGRRALAELRDHLHDSVRDQLSQGVNQADAEENAVRRMGTPEELVTVVMDTSGGLKMAAFLKRHFLATVAVLAAPGVLLLVLSFLTFNFPCREVTYQAAGELSTFRLCGTAALDSIRPLISEPGFYGGPAWVKWSIHVFTVLGPFLASLLIIRSQVSLRRPQSPEETTEIVFALDRKQMVALVATLSIFLTVVAYKAAG